MRPKERMCEILVRVISTLTAVEVTDDRRSTCQWCCRSHWWPATTRCKWQYFKNIQYIIVII